MRRPAVFMLRRGPPSMTKIFFMSGPFGLLHPTMPPRPFGSPKSVGGMAGDNLGNEWEAGGISATKDTKGTEER